MLMFLFWWQVDSTGFLKIKIYSVFVRTSLFICDMYKDYLLFNLIYEVLSYKLIVKLLQFSRIQAVYCRSFIIELTTANFSNVNSEAIKLW